MIPAVEAAGAGRIVEDEGARGKQARLQQSTAYTGMLVRRYGASAVKRPKSATAMAVLTPATSGLVGNMMPTLAVALAIFFDPGVTGTILDVSRPRPRLWLASLAVALIEHLLILDLALLDGGPCGALGGRRSAESNPERRFGLHDLRRLARLV